MLIVWNFYKRLALKLRDPYKRNLDCGIANYPSYDEKEKVWFLMDLTNGFKYKDVNEWLIRLPKQRSIKEGRAYNQEWIRNDGMDQHKNNWKLWSQNELRPV